MKTNVILKFTYDSKFAKIAMHIKTIGHLRVKLDASKFPYVIIDNEKHIIANTSFPVRVFDWNGLVGELDCICGLDELNGILKNPELTTDKLSVSALMRVAH